LRTLRSARGVVQVMRGGGGQSRSIANSFFARCIKSIFVGVLSKQFKDNAPRIQVKVHAHATGALSNKLWGVRVCGQAIAVRPREGLASRGSSAGPPVGSSSGGYGGGSGSGLESRLAAAHSDGALRVWDPHGGRCVRELRPAGNAHASSAIDGHGGGHESMHHHHHSSAAADGSRGGSSSVGSGGPAVAATCLTWGPAPGSALVGYADGTVNTLTPFASVLPSPLVSAHI
jgi:hypothetical protein